MAPRKTEGGTFDPADRCLYFTAGGPGPVSDSVAPYRTGGEYPVDRRRHVLLAVNDCMGKSGEAVLARMVDEGHRVMLDSGIFWLTNEHKRATGITMNEALQLPPQAIAGFDELFERYVELATTYGPRLWGYVELDQGGRKNKIKTRQRLHDLGLSPIPVYHPLNDGWDYFDELATGYDRVCFGNIVQAPPAARVRLLHTLWERRRAYPKLWVHVLGYSPNDWSLLFPFDSCDSSSWLNSLRYPQALTEVAMLRRLSTLDHQFRYELNDAESEALAGAFCGEAATQTATVWRDALAAAPPGAPYPRRRSKEGELKPCE